MTTSTDSTAGAGLPEATPSPFTGPGWYRVRGNGINLPARDTRDVWIAELAEDPEWPRPRRWFGVWLTGDASADDGAAIILGEISLISAIIIERTQA